MLLHRSINIWCQFGQKCLFRGSASTEVGGPQLLRALFQWQKSALHAKFDQDRTSGSWVRQSYVQKTSNARPPLKINDTLCNFMPIIKSIFWYHSNTTHSYLNQRPLSSGSTNHKEMLYDAWWAATRQVWKLIFDEEKVIVFYPTERRLLTLWLAWRVLISMDNGWTMIGTV